MQPLTPILLIGPHTRLEPLTLHHASSLCAAADDAAFEWLLDTRPESVEAMIHWIQVALSWPGIRIPFAIVEGGEVVGSTSYWQSAPFSDQVEIGTTWLGSRWWGIGINTEIKRLMLKHAFVTLECRKVLFRSAPGNERSHRAIEKLGAHRDGLVACDLPLPDRTWRASVYFSMLQEEWEGSTLSIGA